MLSSYWYHAVAILLAWTLPSIAVAQIAYYPTSATINSTVTGLVHVGKDSLNRNSSPTINMVAGADLWQSAVAFNSSQVNMSGGRVRESLIALEGSTVSVTGGEVGGSLWTGSEGTVPIRGGTILMSGGKAVNAGIDRGGTFSMHGGMIDGPVTMSRGGTFYMDDSAHVTGSIGVGLDSKAYISGGIASNGIGAISNGRVSITGGSIGQTARASGQSTINIFGGTTKWAAATGAGTVNVSGGGPDVLSARNSAVINLLAGSIIEFYTEDSSTGNVYDGSVHGDVTAFGKSTINIYGGTIHGKVNAFGTVNIHGGNKAKSSFAGLASSTGPFDLFVLGEGLIQLFGSDLTSTLVDPNVSYEDGVVSGIFSKHVVTGMLLDGTDVTGTALLVQNGTGANFTLISEVPEPRPVVLVGMGLFTILYALHRRGRWSCRRR